MIPAEKLREMIERKERPLTLLHTFFVMGKGSYRQAAMKLGLGGGISAVRKRVASLEKLLGLELVISDSSGHRLTPDGLLLLTFLEGEFGHRVQTAI